eukprot:CAMPEP_0117751506 /NCGR_PEP_ID=MMETSP0947-20121206/11015_1 /TAXON_ID=44440 /ORGANISM="Chattonella subsalsa, Strain CCMP2191" /LENGTH=975 /DNA_ID=CAMNT_0005569899 /DNA_START=115 /DNA_END=3040 /DNA_ORIENTATION=-
MSQQYGYGYTGGNPPQQGQPPQMWSTAQANQIGQPAPPGGAPPGAPPGSSPAGQPPQFHSYGGPGYNQPTGAGYTGGPPGAGSQPPATAPPGRAGGGGFGVVPTPPAANSAPQPQYATMGMPPGAPPGGTGPRAPPATAPGGSGLGFAAPPGAGAPPPPGAPPGQPQAQPPQQPAVAQPPKSAPVVQFYSYGAGGVATPAGPPSSGSPPPSGGVGMGMPPPPTGGPPSGAPPGADPVGSLSAQMGQMGMSASPGSAPGQLQQQQPVPLGPPDGESAWDAAPLGQPGMPGQPGVPGQPMAPPGPPQPPVPGDWGQSPQQMGQREPMPAMPAVVIDPASQCDPRIMQLTIGSVLNSSTQAQSTKIPLGLMCCPMALDDTPEGELDLVNFGTQGIMRCKRCRTYINPFVSWIENGRRWRCNVCGMVNEVPTSYFCHLDADGQRRDKDQRPELAKGSVEFVAPGEYMVRPPQPPVFMFVIDVSTAALQSGMVACAVETIKQSLKSMPGNPRTQIGFVTFDSTVHFYNLKSSLSQPQCYVVSDLEDIFLPCPEDLLVNLSESMDVIEALLESLPSMYQSTQIAEVALGPALIAAYRVMGHVGGKMVVLSANLPSTGEARLKHRENPRMLGTDQEHRLLNAEDGWYKTKAVEFSRLQISVDLFLFSAQYTDVATLQELPKYTAGRCFYYPAFNRLRDGDKFGNELNRVLTQPIVFEAVMRIRSTRGLRITNFYGNYFIRGSDLLALPNCTPEHTYGLEFTYEEQLLTAQVLSIQAALLYTSSCGERRIRVHNLAIPVTTVIQEFINSINIDVLCNLMAKQALDIAQKTGLDFARTRIFQNAADIIRANRGGGAIYGAQQPQQPQIPESLQLLPLYSMALQKNVAFRGGTEVRTDERAFFMMLLANMSVDASRCFIYPRMFSLHNMPDEAGRPCPEQDEDAEEIAVAGKDQIVLPPVVNLSAERLQSTGVFLLEDAFALHVW